MTQATTTARVAVDDLAWMAGSWYGHIDGDDIDEHWSAPAGGVMVGMFRWLKGGLVHLYELLAIEPSDTGPVLRLKHFSQGLLGWEEKGIALDYPLVQAGDREATFERGGAFRATRFVYRRIGDDGLAAVQENRKGDEITIYEFRYTRRAP
jgi:hypothetical protein